MKSRRLLAVAILVPWLAHGAGPIPPSRDDWLARYFSLETSRLESACLSTMLERAQWEAQRPELRRQLLDMLGLWPMPERPPLHSVVTGRIEGGDFLVERLHFQSLPGLYVTANLYLPKEMSGRVPAVLYACGHSRVVTNGVSCGNKAGYQHHGVWFARHGTACLVIDTVQLGEIEGLHHGTYREGMWWWNARGYTPAGVEAWNCIRALDYLETRPEVDPNRLGMTGRSGGGSYSWTTAAVDERVKVAAPVAGLTDLRNQVLDGCVEGHCDCMFFVNTYRWDFPLVAALLAPRPLLIVNTDSDEIFPLDGVVRTLAKVRRVYEAYGQGRNLGLVIGPGPHRDTQDLQVPVFRWMNQHLHGEDPLIRDAAEKRFDPLELRVFDALPADAINARIQETFVPAGVEAATPATLERLQALSFAGWPEREGPLLLRCVGDFQHAGLRLRVVEFESQPAVVLRLFVAEASRGGRPRETVLEVLGTEDWQPWLDRIGALFPAEWTGGATQGRGEVPARVVEHDWAERERTLRTERLRQVWVAPRGVGPTAWAATPQQEVQVRRRFMLLGQTLDGMRVWDIRRAVRALQAWEGRRSTALSLAGRGNMGVNALYAGLYEPGVSALELADLPESHREGPDYLNVLRITDIPEALAMAGERLRSPVRPKR